MHLNCCGINHHKGALAEREQYQLQIGELRECVRDFKNISGVAEAVILSTCTRIEFYCADSIKTDLRASLAEFYNRRKHISNDILKRLLFTHQGTTAARHLFQVTAGLDSPLLGDRQVLGQVKEAYSASCAVDGAGKLLHKLFHNAFQVAKRVQSETEVSSGATGLAGAAVELVRTRVEGRLTGLSAVVIGVNKSTDMILEKLIRDGVRVNLVNRTVANAEKLARHYGIDACSLSDLPVLLASADLLFSATSSPDYLVTIEMLAGRNPELPLLAIDLAVPRDIHPDLVKLPGAVLYDMEDLQHHLAKQQENHQTELPYALELIEEQVHEFETWKRIAERDNSADLREILDLDRQTILNRFRDNFRDGDQKALEAFSRQLYRQFLRRVQEKEIDKVHIS